MGTWTVRKQESLRNDISTLMERILFHDQKESEHLQHETVWQEELDRLVVDQANGMSQRDELIVQKKSLQSTAQRGMAKVAEVGAQLQKAEEKRNRDRKNLNILKQDAEAQQGEAEKAKLEERQAVEAFARYQAVATRSVAWWYRLLGGLAV